MERKNILYEALTNCPRVIRLLAQMFESMVASFPLLGECEAVLCAVGIVITSSFLFSHHYLLLFISLLIIAQS